MNQTMEAPAVVSPYHNSRWAAAYLGMTSKWAWKVVERWARLGKIKAGRVGDKFVFTQQWCDDYVQGRKSRAA